MWRHCKHASPSQIGLNIYPNSILNYKKNDHWVSLCKNKKWLRIWNLRTCRLSKLPHYEVKVVILWHSSSSSQLPSCALHCHSLAQASLLSVSRYSGGKIFFSRLDCLVPLNGERKSPRRRTLSALGPLVTAFLHPGQPGQSISGRGFLGP